MLGCYLKITWRKQAGTAQAQPKIPRRSRGPLASSSRAQGSLQAPPKTPQGSPGLPERSTQVPPGPPKGTQGPTAQLFLRPVWLPKLRRGATPRIYWIKRVGGSHEGHVDHMALVQTPHTFYPTRGVAPRHILGATQALRIVVLLVPGCVWKWMGWSHGCLACLGGLAGISCASPMSKLGWLSLEPWARELLARGPRDLLGILGCA